MRIGILYLHKGGGIGEYTYQLAKTLADKAEVTCYMASQNKLISAFEKLPCKIKVFEMRRGKKALIKAILTGREESGIAEAIKADKPAILLDTGSVWWGTIVARQIGRKIPLAQVVHDVTPHEGPLYIFEKIYNALFPTTAQALVSVSEFSHKELLRLYPKKQHIQSKLGLFLPSEDVDHDKIAQMRNKLLFIGSISAYKGVDILVDAYGIAKQQKPELELSIYGSGEISEETKAKIKAFGIYLRNEFIPEEEMQGIIKSHGIMAMPYISATQSGVAAVALANGMPSVATNVGALPEQVIDKHSGIVVPPCDPQAFADAILEIAGDYDKAYRMSVETTAIGREQFAWEPIGMDLLAALSDLVKKRSA